MGIRKAMMGDKLAIQNLLNQLGYDNTEVFLKEKLEMLLKHPDEELLVYEQENKVIGLMSIHIIPQIALRGDFARISYFSIDSGFRSQRIGLEMEAYCEAYAVKRGCDRIEVHCHSRRTDAHRFYRRQGYEESPKYFMKKISGVTCE